MKVLMIIAYLEFGGTETHVLSMAKMLRQSGVHVGIATYGGPFISCFRSQGVPVHMITKYQKSSLGASNISSIVKKYKYSIIHAHDIESFRMLPNLRKQLPNIPLVMTVHGMYYSKAQLQSAANAANLIIGVSPTVRKYVIQAGSSWKKVKWVPNGIDIQKYSSHSNQIQYRRMLNLPERGKICLYAGRFQSDKWVIARNFILASERIAQKNSSFTSVLIGFGKYRKQLTELAKQINKRLHRRTIYVLPQTNHLEHYYRSANIIVGTGRVALEAMSCGKPVIAVGIAGYEGIVTPKTLNALITNQFGDHAASQRLTTLHLSTDMYRLLSDQELSNFLSSYGQRIVHQHFSIRKVATITRKMYLSL